MAIIQQHLLSMESWSAWTNVFGTSNNDWTYSNNVDDNSNVYLVGLARNGTWGRAWGCLHKFNSAGVAVRPSRMLSSAAVDVTAVPFIDNASVSKVPSTSTSPDISNVAASNSPVIVKFLIPV